MEAPVLSWEQKWPQAMCGQTRPSPVASLLETSLCLWQTPRLGLQVLSG